MRFRFLRAYLTTFVLLGTYFRARLGRRLFGEAWFAARISRVHRESAKRVRRTALALQGLFIKVDQLLSVLSNVLPDDFRAELAALQDRIPPRPYAGIAERVERELGKPIAELFASFEPAPIASASLGQVHEARLHDGTRVIVKVQHLDIEATARADLKTIRRILKLITLFFPIQGMDTYYEQIRDLIAREMDFALEAHNLARIAGHFSADPMVRFPRVINELSTARVMTQTFVEGVRVGDTAALDAAGVDKKALAQRIVRAYCQMIFVDGVYHADPHPGNLLAGPGGVLVFLDFGAVADVSRDMREGMPELLEGIIRRDTDRLMKALKRMGFLARGYDEELGEKVIEYFHRRFQEQVRIESFNLNDLRIDPQRGLENLLDLRKMNVTLRELSGLFQVPRDWVLLQRTFLLLTGVCTELDPSLRPIEIVRPYLQTFVFANRDWAKIALDAAKDTALQALTLPADIRAFLRRAMRGEIEVKSRAVGDASRVVAQAIRQAVLALLAIAAGFFAMQLRHDGEAELARGLGYTALALIVALLLSLVAGPRR